MGIKAKLSMGVACAALGLSLIGGGTYAYFHDAVETNNSFAAGTLDLSVHPSTIIDVHNLKPGDWMNRIFTLTNEGTLPIKSVDLITDYTVNDAKGDNTEDMGKYIRVNFLINDDKDGIFDGDERVVASTTLKELKKQTPDTVKNYLRNLLHIGDGEDSGLKVGDSDKMFVQFEFVDNGKDQNQFQGDSLQLKWTFDAHQTDGEAR